MPAPTASVRWTGMTLALTLTVAVASFEATATSALMPAVVADIGGRSWYPLVFGLYAVAELLGLVAGPVLVRSAGPAGTFVAGAVLHGAGLTLAGTAPYFGWLLAGRVVQGAGAGLVTVAVYVLVGYYPAARRGALLGYLAMCWALPGLAGPVVAGAVAELASWRAVLLGVPLFEVAALGLAARGLRAIGRRRPGGDEPLRAGRRFLAALALAAGVLAVLNVRTLPAALTWAVLGAAVLAILAGAAVLLPSGALRCAPGLPAAVLVRGVVAAPFIGVQYLIPLSLADGRGYTTAGAGLALSGGVVGFSISGLMFTRPWLNRIEPVRVVMAGVVFVVAGMATTAAGLPADRPVAYVFLGWVVAGLGVGLGVTALNVIVLDAAGEAARGTASAGMRVAESAATSIVTAASGLALARAAQAGVAVPAVAALVLLAFAGVLVPLLVAARRLPRRAVTVP